MGTASTKSQGNNKSARSEIRLSSEREYEFSETAEQGTADLSWLVACAAILGLAAFLRFYNLDLVPLHHDEGVNGNFLVRLVREGFYRYDPANYHGPTLYYFAALFPRVLRSLLGIAAQNSYGLTTQAIRAVTSVFGLATVGLVLTLRKNLGTIGVLSASLLLAISPGAVYLSRYFIHETLFVFFTLAIVVCAVKYFETAQPVYLILLAVNAALMFATKETAIISAVVLALAAILTYAYRWLLKQTGSSQNINRKKKKRSSVGDRDPGFVEKAGGPFVLLVWIVAAVIVFVAVNVIFYTSFFTNGKGISDALKTFEFWRKTGKEAHVHPFLTYIWWLTLQESPLLALGAIGAVVSLLKRPKGLGLFCATWAFGLIAAYSLIAYKTPWLTLNFIIPLALASGAALQWAYDKLREFELGRLTAVVVIGFVLVLVTGPLPGVVRAKSRQQFHAKTFIPGSQVWDLNFVNYDNDDRYYVYVYAHTRRETLKLVQEIDRIAQRTHQGGQTGITIVSPDYWPLPWYLRDYTRVGYHGRMATSNEPIVLASQSQADEMQSTFGDRYQLVQSGFNTAGSFQLRPGVDLLLYTRRELVR
ncbi:MAG TPA: flippase activity-associated protein Agl23 [Pyrinomonadaceae bacterium]|nr:flippase activity-associated protein Agl23 [Pyrinomonadaceae bacterium]